MKSSAAAIAGMLILIAARCGPGAKRQVPEGARVARTHWLRQELVHFGILVGRTSGGILGDTQQHDPDGENRDGQSKAGRNRGYLPTSCTPFSFASRRRSLGPATIRCAQFRFPVIGA